MTCPIFRATAFERMDAILDGHSALCAELGDDACPKLEEPDAADLRAYAARWDALGAAQQRALAKAANLAGRGLYYTPSGIGHRSSASALDRKGLLSAGPWVRHEDTGREGWSYALTAYGARVAAQEPGIDRCHLPMPVDSNKERE